MFVPPMYRITDAGKVHDVIRQHPLAMLVSNGPETPYTTHLPVIHVRRGDEPPSLTGFSLYGHLNRANPHWKTLAGGVSATLMFTGPTSYVTPAVYDTPVAAPTWNFVTVELTGDLVPLTDREETLEVVRRTAAEFEERFGGGWESSGSVDYFRSIVGGVGAFRFDVVTAKAMFKLSQEKKPAIRDRIADRMRADGDDTRRELGVYMRQTGRTEKAGRPALWGGPAHPECLLHGLARAVRERPDEIALIDGETKLTYARLWAWTADLAAMLRGQGLGPGSRVAVTGERGARTVAAFLATVAVGATYVPLDASYPLARLEFMLRDSGASLVLHDGPAPDFAAGVPSRAIGNPTDGDTAGFEPVACEPDLPVYVIYTSGSTGQPKGVTIQHSNLDNMAVWQRTDSVRGDLRTAQFAPLNFDVCFQEILGTLTGGGTLVIAPEPLRRDPFRFLAWLAENEIERLFLPYVALHMLAVAASAQDGDLGLSLVEVNTAGEQMLCTPPIQALFQALPGARLGNHYGQSESAMVSSHVLPADPAEWPLLPPIGTPLPGCELLVDPVDPDDPNTGELLVAGASVSLGYLDRPELNAERFITVERTPHGHTTAFRTGDLVRVENGLVYFLSRLDHDVKIRGIRVNLLEIEVCLMRQPGVTTAVCVAVELVPGSRQLRAAVTLDPDGPEPGDLRAALKELLPEASVPVAVDVLPSLPRTPSGKIDRDSVAKSLSPGGDL